MDGMYSQATQDQGTTAADSHLTQGLECNKDDVRSHLSRIFLERNIYYLGSVIFVIRLGPLVSLNQKL